MNSKVKDGNQNISAFVRVRPFNSTEKHRSVVDILSGNEICVKDNKQHSASKSYTFNQVFGSKSSQIEVYKSVVSPLINEVLSGYNCTVFAYGQTGTGKTFTMEGERSSDCNVLWETDSLAGIVPRTLSQLFDELRILDSDFTVKVSFLELYNEELIDLLSPPDDTTKLKIFEDSSKKGSVIISGLEEVSVPHKSAVYQILERGSIKRQTAATLLNAHSSRSHTVFTVTVHMRLPSVDGEDVMRTGKMNLVDLAGSENIGRSGAVKHRAREAGNINQSLLTLGRVITALADQSPHVPYRESKLTRILQESLGGRTKTSIIATVSPSASNLEETISTLEYAHRAKKIKNRPEVNQKFCKKTVLKEYSAEIERLQRDLEATQLRSGIFLDQAEYDDLILILDQLEADIKSRAQEQAALQEEMEKMMGVCDELSNEVKNVEESVQERTAVCEEQKVALSGLKAKTTGVVIDAVEKSYLLKHHMETLQQLTSQTDVIRQTTMNSVANAELLSDKVDRARNASLLNQTSIEDFVAKSNSIFDDAVDIIEGEMKTVSHDAQDLKSELNKALLEVDSHISNTQSAASAFSLIDEQCINFRSTLTNADLQDTELRSKMSSLLPKFPSAGSAHIENLSSLAKEYVKATEESLGDIDNKITELKTFYDLTTLQVIEDIPKCVESRSAQLEKALNCASKRAQNACKILDDIKQEDNSFYDSYFHLLEKMEQKYAAMQKLASEIQSLQLESLQLVESHEHNEKIKVDSVLAEVAEASSLCNADFNEEESLLALIQSQVERNLKLLSEQVEHLAAKCVINLPFLPMDIIILKEREVKDAFSQFLSDVNDCLKEDVTASKQLASVFSTYSKESEVTMTTICNDVKTHIGLLTSTLENLRKNTPNKLMAIVTRMSSFLTQFKEKMDEYENAVEHVLQFGVKPASPTGKTPVRSKLNIPRNLAATSPHERILSRLRSKYKSDINLETLSDCAFSDLESDRGLTLDEKENSLVERNEEGNSSKVSMLRKPLSQSN